MPTPAITMQLDDADALAAFRRLQQRAADLRPAFRDVGEYLIVSTRARFVTSTGPDGTPWQRNSETTYLRMLDRAPKTTRKDGHLNAKGSGLAIRKKPLIGDSKQLSTKFSYHADRTALVFGSPMIYAAMQQFDAQKGEFGNNKRGSPIPWGNIPARPFIGLSATDTDQVLSIVTSYLTSFGR